jgi:AmmeMemoRadiSam system protein A
LREAPGDARRPRDEPWLLEPGATFVTLRRGEELRGCVGSIEAFRPLGEDVRRNAVAAALRDTRFPPLAPEELDEVEVEVTLLSPPEPMRFDSEADALAQLRPGEDGLLLSWGNHRSTFLPQVWESLPRPEAFLESLKRKAGLAPDFWHRDLRLSRYTAVHWCESEVEVRGAL